MHRFALALALALALFSATGVLAVNPLVSLNYAKYQGTALKNGITQWLGMAYAAPPTGEFRFAAPQAPTQNDNVQDADQHGPLCISTGVTNLYGMSEDCLYLDVYAPTAAKTSSKYPVYFWIQGGGFEADSNAFNNGSGLIEAGDMEMLVVTFNYRVGAYGFLASEEVVEGASMNNGLKDIIMALQWVQKYISKFGGDPNHVVLGGDSAGAGSIVLLLTAYGGRNDSLFVGAAGESPSFQVMLNVSQAQYQYDDLVQQVGCGGQNDTLSCIRSVDTTVLQTANINVVYPGNSLQFPVLTESIVPPLYMWGPVIDGDLIPDYTYNLLPQGKFIKVPVIFGDDTNGGTIFTPRFATTAGAMDVFLKGEFPNLTDQDLIQINNMYQESLQFPLSGAYWRATSDAYGDMRYMCPNLYVSTAFANASVTSNWNYRWNVIDPTDNATGIGVYHTVEVNAIWGPDYVNGGGAPASYTTTNAHIVSVVQGYWTSFVRSLDPNTHRLAGTPLWEPFNASDWGRLMFQTNESAMELVSAEQKVKCDFFAGIGAGMMQ